MFKKSRRKIVAAIMLVLVLLWVGTLGVIYTSSYFEMKKQNVRMLQTHAQMHTLSPPFEEMAPPNKPKPDGNRGSNPQFNPESPLFRLSTFYTVAISRDGEILEIKNEKPTVYRDDDLERIAREIINDGKESGTTDNLAYYKCEKEGYSLVVLMDNTLVNESAFTLIRYTLLFGGGALLLFFFLSLILAKKIVDPLEESYQKQKRFISDAGHELKTPISVIGANAELLSREIGENTWLQNIQYENERMGSLVGQLLTLARSEAVTKQTRPINLSRLVAGEVLPLESVAFEKGLTLNCNIGHNISVSGNEAELKQLVSILVDNAISHNDGSGEIYIYLTREQGYATLSVINKGDEIPKKHLDKIFERFYRVDQSRNRDDGHYGLGLAIARAITVNHKGKIDALCYDGLVEFKVKIPAI